MDWWAHPEGPGERGDLTALSGRLCPQGDPPGVRGGGDLFRGSFLEGEEADAAGKK